MLLLNVFIGFSHNLFFYENITLELVNSLTVAVFTGIAGLVNGFTDKFNGAEAGDHSIL